MYFRNIANAELQHFHNSVGADINMSLTEILNSNLFHVQNMGNNIYRIFPLFYCKNVISSNPLDKCSNSKCLILVRDLEHETYVSFMTDSEKSNVLFTQHMNVKNIGENLTTEEFNALVYRLRKGGALNGVLNYEEIHDITGSYGTYIFNVDGQLKNDTGLIINDKIKYNPLTVKLVNPFFKSARYTLTFTVRSITGANICDTENTDYKTIDTFDVVLIENQEVDIPVSEYANDSVLLFDVDVNIDFNVPEIVNDAFTLKLDVDDGNIVLDETVTLTATLTYEGDVAEGYVAQFYDNDTLIDVITTNGIGQAVLEDYQPQTAETHNFKCICVGLTTYKNVRVTTKKPAFSNIEIVIVDSRHRTVSGYLLDGATPVENMSIFIKAENTTRTKTDENGYFRRTVVSARNAFTIQSGYNERYSAVQIHVEDYR